MYILEVEITDNTIEISNPGSDKVETYDASRDIRGKNLKSNAVIPNNIPNYWIIA